MELTAENVETVLVDCLYNDDENTDNMIKTEMITCTFGFHPDRLESHREDVYSMLMQLPDSFMASSSGGWSFLQACVDNQGHQWGEHRNMEQLFALGVALGLVTIPLPKMFWSAMPGGMPYFTVLDKKPLDN